ncbi:T9SS type A sorting domain-containing protein [Lacibacter luteus]|uniref:T9SS type A sorting domain-containing protein n=1 Tax=Lacibacter luteus TaxID=2508719 RepID=A0A4V1M7E9_9BACT|nr:pectinesterase family protein [Lacibacter luteus]RXK59632.1 T9SS type A sorting domain-containing protein [Lacibacter luteus]
MKLLVNACLPKRIVTIFSMLLCMCTMYAQQIAFPGAEGAGRFTSGGRGTVSVPTTVFEVTNLNDDGSVGTLRYAVNQTATHRTVVFRVSGTIHLTSKLNIRANTTIAGQTAPGDGICLADYPVVISGDNVIMRYIRCRMGDKNQLKTSPANCGVPVAPFTAACMPLDGSGGDDALGNLGNKNIIIDHCSVSWSSDEALTVYRGDSVTMQWNIISEPLNYSYHFETGDTDFENHGYGGIWGSLHGSFHHNLIAHCRNRNPRFAGNSTYPAGSVESADFRNNVLYNWGINTIYGGDGGQYNLVNNYYKYGPNTSSGVRYRIVGVDSTAEFGYAKYFLSGNYVDGSTTNTNNNWLGASMNTGVVADTVKSKSTSAFLSAYLPVTTHTAQEAYELVLQYAGASLKRDTLDARVANDVRNRTGKIIDVQGGFPHGTPYASTLNAWPTLSSTAAPTDTDHDGMPDAWETANSLNPNDASDRGIFAANNYTNLENYLNSILESQQNNTPTIYSSASFTAFAQTIGSPSTSQSFTVSALNLTAALNITAPASYEVSLNNTAWGNNVSLTPNSGVVGSTTIYVRLNATTAGSYVGNIVGTSTGATNMSVAVTGTASQNLQDAAIGYFPNIDGGFENQTVGTYSTVTSHTSATNWEVSAAWDIKTGDARTGNKIMYYKQASTSVKYMFSPVLSNPALSQNTDYVIQFWYKPVGTLSAATVLTGSATLVGATGGTGTSLTTATATLDASTPQDWQLFTGTLKTAATTPTSTYFGMKISNPQSPYFYIDDYVAYPGTAVDNTAPDAVTNLAAVGSPTAVALTWSAPATGIDNGGYLIVRSTVSAAPSLNTKGVYAAGNTIGADYTVLYTGTSTSFNDGTVTTGATYYYHVFTADKAFNYAPVATISALANNSNTPTILATASFTNFTQTIGSASAVQKATVSGTNLTGDVTVTAPSNYEVSLNGTTWTSSVTLSPSSGTIAATEISVRLNAASAGIYNGNITVAGGGATSKNLAVNGVASNPVVTPAYDVLVAKDGSGNYTSVQAAITAAPTNRTTPWRIFIKKGKYVETVVIPSNKPFMQLMGENMAETIISYDNYSGKVNPAGGTYGTSTCGTMIINAADVMLMNLSVENATGYGINANAIVPAPGDGPQAVAVYTTSDRVVFFNVRMNSGQDTYYGGNNRGTRVYMKNSYIDGNTDFIFGSSTIIFDTCVIYPRTRLDNGSGGFVTAANTKLESGYGYVFRDCKLTKNRGITFYTLGRPWQNDAGTADASKSRNKTVFLNSFMGSSIKPEGWSAWDAGTNTSYITYAEYNTKNYDGTVKDVSGRVNWSKQLTAGEAAKYYNNDTVFVNANTPVMATWNPYSTWPELNNTFVPELSASNLIARKPNVTSATVNVTWNITWPMSGIKCELYRSADKQNFSLIDTQHSSEDSAANFSFADVAPAAGTSYYYIVRLSKTGFTTTTSDTAFVSSKPTITVTGALSDFLQGIGTPSTTQTFLVSGLNIIDSIKIAPPVNYEVSANGGTTWYNNATPLGLKPTSGTVASTTITLRLNGTVVGTYNDNIIHSGTLADTVKLAVRGTIQSQAVQISSVLQHWPFTQNNQDSAAIRSAAVIASAPTFNKFAVSDGVTVAGLLSYSLTRGQAFAATADGYWTTASGGPGGNLNRTNYQQFTITANAGYTARVDSMLFNHAFYATSSNTKIAVVYSRSGFTTDSVEVTGYEFATGKTVAQDNNGPSIVNRFPLNGSTGVTLTEGQTLSIRLYYSCGSTSAGRYLQLKDFIVKGIPTQNVPTSVIDNLAARGFALYPNPASSSVIIKHPRSGSNTSIALYSLLGVKIAEWKATPNTTQTSVDVQALPQGQYFIHYNSGKEKAVLKCIVVH